MGHRLKHVLEARNVITRGENHVPVVRLLAMQQVWSRGQEQRVHRLQQATGQVHVPASQEEVT